MSSDIDKIKIIDFDAARIKKPTADKDTKFIGTDGFASPEQYGFMQTDKRTDLHALGVTLKLLLGEDYAKSRYKPVIEKCSRFNPEERYPSAKAVKSALFRSKFAPFLGAAAAALLVLTVGITVPNLVRSQHSDTNDILSDTSSDVSEITAENSTAIISEPDNNLLDVSAENSSNQSDTPDSYGIWRTECKWLVLPQNFPKLSEAVSIFDMSNQKDYVDFNFCWRKMPYDKAENMIPLLRDWLGENVEQNVIKEDEATL